ncbi:MAG: (deoxy)nucleoside triphosphate pyrophosphohydrolase [Pseudomonadota bacterium]
MQARLVHRVVAAVIEREGKYLITQRREGALLPLLWEFPGGRVEPGEDDATALLREGRERIGVDLVVERKLAEQCHPYDGYDVQLALYSCKLGQGEEPTPAHVRDIRWVSLNELSQYQFPPADQATMDQLLGLGEANRSVL